MSAIAAWRSAEFAAAPFELRALDRVGRERDRALVGALPGAGDVARAAEQIGVRRVQWLVALERRVLEERLEQFQPFMAGPSARLTATARLSSITGDGLRSASAP